MSSSPFRPTSDSRADLVLEADAKLLAAEAPATAAGTPLTVTETPALLAPLATAVTLGDEVSRETALPVAISTPPCGAVTTPPRPTARTVAHGEHTEHSEHSVPAPAPGFWVPQTSAAIGSSGTAVPAAYVMSTGAAFPATKYTTEKVIEAFHAQRAAVGDTSYDRGFADRVFSACKYDLHSIALPKSRLFVSMKRSEYLEHRRTAMVDLAERACRQALERWGGDPAAVTHLYWGTMTGGMDSPTIDITLTKRLGLSLDVKRTSIEGMGCLTGFRLLNLANETALGNPNARILVVAADLRSALGNLLPPRVERADMVSCALFRDAASACVVGGSRPVDGEAAPLYEIMSGMSRIVPDSRDNVFYNELDGGFLKLHLSKDLPLTVAANEPAFVGDLLQRATETARFRHSHDSTTSKPAAAAASAAVLPNLADMDVACHTGGPRVLREVAAALGTADDRLSASWAVMKANGNLSGASNLAVLDEQSRRKDGRDWVVCLSMGPGVCLEGLVLRRPGALAQSPRSASELSLSV